MHVNVLQSEHALVTNSLVDTEQHTSTVGLHVGLLDVGTLRLLNGRCLM